MKTSKYINTKQKKILKKAKKKIRLFGGKQCSLHLHVCGKAEQQLAESPTERGQHHSAKREKAATGGKYKKKKEHYLLYFLSGPQLEKQKRK